MLFGNRFCGKSWPPGDTLAIFRRFFFARTSGGGLRERRDARWKRLSRYVSVAGTGAGEGDGKAWAEGFGENGFVSEQVHAA